MKYYLKDHVTDEMLVALGFDNYINGDMYRKTSRGRFVIMYRCNRQLKKIMYGSPTYTGYKYANEHRLDVKRHIKDLIDLGYVEARK